ncbi:hypothetical protein SAY87_013375 [Trapa incisa]|uniref:Uncharacterized protein n=1 Tax=Trapa incisa TaxID=236973 RepID=A0AAN7QCZ3_9MYRT|nr:hypothetical protein SAY87_013375 [Trapa incisa]
MGMILASLVGVLFGFFIGVSFLTLSLTKLNLSSSFLPEVDFSNSDGGKIGTLAMPVLNATLSPHLNDSSKVWVPSNPRGAERLAPRIVAAESDLYLHRLWGNPSEDLTSTPRYLVTFTVGYDQRNNIDTAVKKEISQLFCFTMMDEPLNGESLSGPSRLYISGAKADKMRFLHPDIVAPYDYIFIWDEDLGVENFDAERYIKLVRKHGLEISQPGLESKKRITWKMTKRRNYLEVHKFIEIMAPVFSRDAWRCVWHMLQNDLVHGWGLDFVLRKCVEPAHDKIRVVDAQWVVHQSVPSLSNQGEQYDGKFPWRAVGPSLQCYYSPSLSPENLRKEFSFGILVGNYKFSADTSFGSSVPLDMVLQVRERCLNE